MKKILVCAFSNPKTDPRVKRQLSALHEKYEVSFIGYGDGLDFPMLASYVPFPAFSRPEKRFVAKAGAALRKG